MHHRPFAATVVQKVVTLAAVMASVVLFPGCTEPGDVADPGTRIAPTGDRGPTALLAQRGKTLFDGNCVACHQADARGIPGVYPSLVGSPVLLGDVRALTLWVTRGIRPPGLDGGTIAAAFDRGGAVAP